MYRTLDRAGTPSYVRTSGRPFYDANGDLLGYRGVASDVTAAIRADQAEQALREMQVELAHVSRVTTLGELTASISHEVNQPLAGVIANAGACLGWLDRERPDLEAARRSLKWIIEDGNRATEVIQRIRALAKKAKVDMVPLDLNEAVREAMVLLERELLNHDISLSMELASSLPRIVGDRVQLQQVIINLVTISIDAMAEVNDRTRKLTVRSGQQEKHSVFVAFTDSGAGISAENLDSIFNPFFSTKVHGMGIGLSICRSIVETHGGQLVALRNQSPGATFKMVMPSCGFSDFHVESAHPRRR